MICDIDGISSDCDRVGGSILKTGVSPGIMHEDVALVCHVEDRTLDVCGLQSSQFNNLGVPFPPHSIPFRSCIELPSEHIR